MQKPLSLRKWLLLFREALLFVLTKHVFVSFVMFSGGMDLVKKRYAIP
jgi:hypothetical protein